MADIVINNQAVNDYDFATAISDEARQVFQQSVNPFENNFPTEDVPGRDISIPRFTGIARSTKVDIDGDRRVAPAGTKLERNLGQWDPYQLVFRLGYGQSTAAQASFRRKFMADIMGVKARDGAQIVIDALNKVPTAKTAQLKNSDLAAFLVNADVGWDEDKKKRTTGDGTGTATRWNRQKIEEILELVEHHHLMSSMGNPLVLTDVAALGGLGEDEQSINRDYSSPMEQKGVIKNGMMGMNPDYKGLAWGWLGAVPKGEGFTIDTSGQLPVGKYFVCHRECLSILQPEGEPRYKLDIFDDPMTQSTWYIFVENQGALVTNPQGVGVVYAARRVYRPAA